MVVSCVLRVCARQLGTVQHHHHRHHQHVHPVKATPPHSNRVPCGHARNARLEEAIKPSLAPPCRPRYCSAVPWNLLIAACCRRGCLGEARRLFDEMPDKDTVSWNSIVSAYAKNGLLEEAWTLFRAAPTRNVVSWNAMIFALARHGRGDDALALMSEMELFDVKPDRVTFIGGLDACGRMADLRKGKLVHASCIARFDSCGLDVALANAFVNMYGKCGSLQDAVCMFDGTRFRNVISWTGMISTLARNGQGGAVLELFLRMLLEGVRPNPVTFVTVLNGGCPCLQQAKNIHAFIVESGCESDVPISNALIHAYGTCGKCPRDARRLFDRMPWHDLISWTTMIATYALFNKGESALELFHRMGWEDMKPNNVTFVVCLNACAGLGSLRSGKAVHANIVCSGRELDYIVSTTLIDMYGKCGSVEDARLVFDSMAQKDTASWTAMIAAYAQNGHGKIALGLFEGMELGGVKPNSITLASVLDAYTDRASLHCGKAIHARLVQGGYALDDVVSGTVLIDMYGKCGSLRDAIGIFNKMPKRNVSSWTALIAAYARNGQGKEALQSFWRMNGQGARPNKITFVSILSACNQAGLVDDGWRFFISMYRDHCIVPSVEHYANVINLLGRSGRLDEAEDLIIIMPLEAQALVWPCFLSSCQIHDDLERGGVYSCLIQESC